MPIVADLLAAGVKLEPLPGGKLRATGNLTDAARTLIRSHKPAILAELEAANDVPIRVWRVTYPNGATMEVLFHPPATRADAAAIYPGATLEPLPDEGKRQATPVEAAELCNLVNIILADTDDAERAEALRVACADAEAALTSLRALVVDNDRDPEARVLPDAANAGHSHPSGALQIAGGRA